MSLINYPVGHVILAEAAELPPFALQFPNLASAELGAAVLAVSDEWFAPAQRMLAPSDPIFVVGKFDDHGKWMDGWETRRKRVQGYDYAVVKLGLKGRIHGVDIDTSHFTGNFPPAAAVEACVCTGQPDATTEWHTIVPATSLRASSHHFVAVDAEVVYTHVRLNIFPDGGVARFRVYGQPQGAWLDGDEQAEYELSSVLNGASVVAVSDAHFGLPSHLLYPGRGVNMGDGWETSRRRVPGNEWCIIALGHACEVSKLEIDTAHFKGNYPDSVSVQAANVTFGTDASLVTQAMFWPTLLAQTPAQMDHQHIYAADQLQTLGRVTHVKLNIFPDGGVSRLRIWGRLVK